MRSVRCYQHTASARSELEVFGIGPAAHAHVSGANKIPSFAKKVFRDGEVTRVIVQVERKAHLRDEPLLALASAARRSVSASKASTWASMAARLAK